MLSHLKEAKFKDVNKFLSSTTNTRAIDIDRLLRPKALSGWKTIKICGENCDPHEVMKTCASFLHLYPDVVKELKLLLEDADRILTWVNPLLRTRVRWARDVYFEKNYRFTVSDMFEVISKHYTSWSVEKGRYLMIAMALQLVRSDLQASSYMRENIEIEAPIHTEGVAGSASILSAVKHEVWLELFSTYFSLVDIVKRGVGRDKPLFDKGAPMLESDLRDSLLVRRRPLFALLYDLNRLDSDMEVLCALLSGYYYNVRTPNWDIVGDIIHSQEIIDVSRYLNFFMLVYENDAYLTALCNLALPKEEIVTKVRRVLRYMNSMSYFDDIPISQVWDETSVLLSRDLTGEVKGLALLGHMAAKQDNLCVLRSKTSDYSQFLITVEEKSFSGLNTLLKSNGRWSNDLLTGKVVEETIETLAADQFSLEGFLTNLEETELRAIAIALSGSKIFLTEPATKFTVSTATITSLTEKPEICFPVQLSPAVRIDKWTHGGLTHMFYLKSDLQFILGYLSNDGAKLLGNTAAGHLPSYKTGKPRLFENGFFGEFSLAVDYLNTFADTRIKELADSFDLKVAYGGKDYTVTVDFKKIFSEYWLKNVFIYGEPIPKVVRSLNYSLSRALMERHFDQIHEDIKKTAPEATMESVKRRLDNVILDHLREMIQNSALLRRIYQYALNAVVLAITRDSGSKAEVHAAMLYKHLSNLVGREVIFQYARWTNCLPLAAIVEADETIDRVTDLEFRALFN